MNQTTVDMDRLNHALRNIPGYIYERDLLGWEQRYAARCLTDVLDCDNRHAALSNVTAWIQIVYKEGKEAGRREEQQKWTDRIKQLFGL